MTSPDPRARDVFLAAIEIGTPEARAAHLDKACAGDAALRRRVEALLSAHERPESLLDEGVALGPGATHSHPPDDPAPSVEGPGALIGPYRLLERLGEGGMGIVFRAEQTTPVRREVALKLIKPGMDTAQVLARFDAERHALERMDHPNIARVLDAGATPAGRPYFVMELVRGVPITRYCDEKRLTPQPRLELFAAVCAAVQHAHQKGIIHRDVKPSNTLVAEVDGQPVPKVIDFGVAKAIDQQRAERTLFTQHGAIVGTPEYMSPEQAGSTLDVDTRTDVYSLGVLLYELLTGTTPLDRESRRRAALDEVLRQVREVEPPKPSARLIDSGDRLPSVAAVRSMEPARLARLVRGDLDWIVLRALEKDRARRYETADSLARDIRRYLDGDPVEAGPPSRTYRLRKFTRKHRAALAATTAFALLLVSATAVSTFEAWRAIRAERLAEGRLADTRKAQAATRRALGESSRERERARAVSTFLIEAFRKPRPEQDGRKVTVVEVLDQAAARLDAEFVGDPMVRGPLLDTIGETYMGLGLPARAVELFEKAWSVRATSLGHHHRATLATRDHLGSAYIDSGRAAQAIPLLQETLELLATTLEPDHPDMFSVRNNLAAAYQAVGRTADATQMNEGTLRLLETKLGPDHPNILTCRNNLAVAYAAVGRAADAIRMNEETLRLLETKLGPDHPTSLASRINLAGAYRSAGHVAEAITMQEETLRLSETKLGPEHPYTLTCRNSLALAYRTAGRVAEAISLHEETYRLRKAKFGPDYPCTLETMASLGADYLKGGKTAEGVRLMEDALRRAGERPDALAPLAWLPERLTVIHQAAGRFDKAESLLRAGLERARGAFGPGDPRTAEVMAVLGRNSLLQDKNAEAEPVLRECLATLEKKLPDHWSRFSAQSLLGGAVLGQHRFAEAEPLLIEGYRGLKAHAAEIPPSGRFNLSEAAERIVRLYEAWGKPDQAAAWKTTLGLADLPEDVFARP